MMFFKSLVQTYIHFIEWETKTHCDCGLAEATVRLMIGGGQEWGLHGQQLPND